MISVSTQDDLVILDLGGRKRDILLSCSQAYKLVDTLIYFARMAEVGTPTLVKGEIWEVGVESYDGCVAVRVVPPHSGYVGRVPVPPGVARKLADLIRFKAQQATYKMRFIFN